MSVFNYMKKNVVLLCAFISFLFVGCNYAFAQNLSTTSNVLWAKVENFTIEKIYVNGEKQEAQNIDAKILFDAQDKNKIVQVVNPLAKVKKGEIILVHKDIDIDGVQRYSFFERVRMFSLFFLFLVFAGSVILLGGRQGVRSLFALLGSVFGIIAILNPMLLAGYSPFLVTLFVGSIIAALAVFVTHGFNKSSLLAFLGTISAVLVAIGLSYVVQYFAQFSGYTSEESIYLMINTKGSLDITAIMMGGIIIAMLGVLDDIAITQVAVVRQLRSALPNDSVSSIFSKALVVGRDHASALVNTLVLAYAGSSLPMMLFLQSSQTNIIILLNQESFALEIVKMLVGSIGLIACVPITTFLAAYYLKSTDQNEKHTEGCVHVHH